MKENLIIFHLKRDQLFLKIKNLLGQDVANVHDAPEYRFRFRQRKKICSSGLEMFLILRLSKGQPYCRYFMSRQFCHRRALFHLNNDSTGFYFLKLHHQFGIDSQILAFYFANIHHIFCLLNPPQFSNPMLVLGKIAWTLYFGRVFDNKVIDINEAMANRLATYGHNIIGDPLSSLVVAMTNRGMCNFLLSRFQDKESIYYHIAWAVAYLKDFQVPRNTKVMESLRTKYWALKNAQKNINVSSVLLPGETMDWSGSICLDAIWALSKMTKKGLPGKQRPDITMAERLVENFSQLVLSCPLSLRYRQNEIEICDNHRAGACLKS